MATTMTPEQRRVVLASVREAVASSWRGAFSDGERARPGGVDEIEARLDPLIDIVRRTTATRIEPFLVQILDDICDKCPHQLPSAHCPLRYQKRCVLYECAPAIVSAIGETLAELGDEEFLRTHPFRRENA
jgi:hypothetical protein